MSRLTPIPACLLSTLFVACSDPAVNPDLACDSVLADTSVLLAEARACEVDADCAVIPLEGSCDYACAVAVNGASLESAEGLVDEALACNVHPSAIGDCAYDVAPDPDAFCTVDGQCRAIFRQQCTALPPLTVVGVHPDDGSVQCPASLQEDGSACEVAGAGCVYLGEVTGCSCLDSDPGPETRLAWSCWVLPV